MHGVTVKCRYKFFDIVVLYLLLCTAYVNNIRALAFLMGAHSVLWETGSRGKAKVISP